MNDHRRKDPERLPTEAEIVEVVHTFYAKVQDDELLAPVFASRLEAEDWEAHLPKMVDFWSSILRSSGRYRGQPLMVHGRLGALPQPLWDRWQVLFAQSAHERCPPFVADLFVSRARQIGGHLSRRLAAGPRLPIRA